MTYNRKGSFTCYTSNSFKNLRKKCNDQIASSPLTDKTYLATPSNETKNFFIEESRKEHSHVFGIRFITIQQFIHLTLKISYKKNLSFPSHYELMYFLEEQITVLLQSDQEIALPLKEYVEESQMRISSLASTLSHVFLDYLLYGKEVLPSWLEKNLWQQFLFKKVTNRWTSIIDAIEKCPEPPFTVHLHIFCVDHIAELYLQFFEKLQKHFHFHLYFFSPSPLFWGDVISEKKQAYIDALFQKKGVSLEKRLNFSQMAKNSNALLSHFCDYGKHLYLHLHEKEIEEDYKDIEIENNLTYIQKCLVYQVHSEKPPLEDSSFRMINAPTILREVEIVLSSIDQFLLENKDLHPSDIAVLAPNIDLYYPYISFLLAKSEKPYSYTISNLSAIKHNEEMKSLHLLFSLIESRFEKEQLIKLFSCPLFQRRNQLGSQELAMLEKIISFTNIRFGFNQESKSLSLESDSCCSFGLFDKGFSHILTLLAQKNSPIEFSQSECIGDVISIIEDLYADISSFKAEKRTLQSWVQLSVHFANKYLYLQNAENIFFKEIKKITPLSKTSSFLYCFDSFKKIYQEIFAKKGAIEKTYEKPVITFSTIEDSPPNNKVLFFIGLDEEAFPKKETHRSLHELKDLQGYQKHTSNTKMMRYYILKAIFSTKKSIYFSYCSKHHTDGSAKNPSLLLTELIHALKLDPPEVHPISSFHPSYFTKEHCDEKGYNLCQHNSQKTMLQLQTTIEHQNEEIISVECNHLRLLFSAPSQFFYNLATNVYENTKHTNTSIDDAEFTLSYLDRAIFKQDKLFDDELHFEDLVAQNKLPCALFEKAATKEIKTAIEHEKHLIRRHISKENPYFSVTLSKYIDKIFEKDSTIFCPAISIKANEKTYIIEGSLQNISKQGLLCFKKKSPQAIWKLLPSLILLSNIDIEVATNIIFLESGETIEFSRMNLQKIASSMLAYYEKALQHESPLIPEAIDQYLKENSINFTALQTKITEHFPNPYLKRAKPAHFLFFNEELTALTSIIEKQTQKECL